MLVGERMSKPVISVPPDMPIVDALNLMKTHHISRTPVMDKDKLVGIVSDEDLKNASTSSVTSLSMWELNYLLSKIKVRDVMTKEVLTVTESTPIEATARMMADNRIGGMPVMRGDRVVGIITETDLFKIFLELMGAREEGLRATILMTEKPGQLAALTKAISDLGGNFIAFGQFAGDKPSNRLVTFKVKGVPEAQLIPILSLLAEKVIDLRTC